MPKINYEDKENLNINSDIPRRNKVTGEDLNEIKESVNELYDTTYSLQAELSNEIVNREQQINTAIVQESEVREGQFNTLNSKIEDVGSKIDGTGAFKINGIYLSDIIDGGRTQVNKSLFPEGTIFIEDKTLIYDKKGTVGKYIGEVDATEILVETISVSKGGAVGSEVVISEEKPTHACTWWHVIREKIIEEEEIKKINLETTTTDTVEPYRISTGSKLYIKEI